jgi:triosephosphate isomerase
LANVFVATQDISIYEQGSYTGEVSAKSLQGLVEYSIIGHSERRSNFYETDEVIAKKIELAHKYQIKTILCIRTASDRLFDKVEMIAYEPVGAIGTGNNASVENVLTLKNDLSLDSSVKFLYGGSITDENVSQYFHTEQIDGLLIGGASLDAERFLRIVSEI